MADSKENSKGSAGLWIWLTMLVGFIFFLSNSSNGNLQTREEFLNSTSSNSIGVYSYEDRNNLLMLVLCEAGNQPLNCKTAVAATVLNRVKENAGSTITSVIVAPNQFSSYCGGAFYVGGNAVSLDYFSDKQIADAEAAIDSALVGGDPTKPIGGALYYYNINGISEEERTSRVGQRTMKFGDLIFFREW